MLIFFLNRGTVCSSAFSVALVISSKLVHGTNDLHTLWEISFKIKNLNRGLKLRDPSFETTKSSLETTIHCLGWGHDYRRMKPRWSSFETTILVWLERESKNFSSAHFCAFVAGGKTAIHLSYIVPYHTRKVLSISVVLKLMGKFLKSVEHINTYIY